MKSLLLSGCLVVWLAYGCEDTGPVPIDMPWQVQINELKGIYQGTCYVHTISSLEYFDTLNNVTITIDSLERIQYNGMYTYVLTDENGFFKFMIPEDEFVKDTVDMFAIGPSQTYTKTFQFIRSQRFLYSKSGVYPGFGFMITECYCTKQ
ncbi:MAG: hypothetical protein WBB31_09650 [Saprospiraceae bacterium]